MSKNCQLQSVSEMIQSTFENQSRGFYRVIVTEYAICISHFTFGKGLSSIWFCDSKISDKVKPVKGTVKVLRNTIFVTSSPLGNDGVVPNQV